MPQSFRVAAIPSKVADLVRSTMRSPGYGHPAHAEVATGYGPCRHCLRDFEVGKDRRILFTYDPFHGIERCRCLGRFTFMPALASDFRIMEAFLPTCERIG